MPNHKLYMASQFHYILIDLLNPTECAKPVVRSGHVVWAEQSDRFTRLDQHAEYNYGVMFAPSHEICSDKSRIES